VHSRFGKSGAGLDVKTDSIASKLSRGHAPGSLRARCAERGSVGALADV